MKGWVLIAGYGSIGRRHFRNLEGLGVQDVRLLRSGRKPAAGFETPPGTPEYADAAEAFADRPSVVIVSNPTALHASTVRSAVEAGASVLLEKPVCASIDEARELLDFVRETGGVCSMAYCFRYHPLYRRLHELVAAGSLGRVFHVQSWQASYLPGWHPWEDYRTGYAARENLGGGVVRTLDHDLDMLRWMLGQPTEVIASAASISGIDVEVEDTADMIFRFGAGVQANVHVSFGSRGYRRGMSVSGDRAVATLDWKGGMLTIDDGSEAAVELKLEQDFDLNTMYVDMLRAALDGFSAARPEADIPLADGVSALEMAEAALEAGESSRAVRLRGVESIHASYRAALQT